MDDQSWIYHRMKSDRLNLEYIMGVRRFIKFTYSIDKNISMYLCEMQKSKVSKEDDVCKHLLTESFYLHMKSGLYTGSLMS
ncbi:hypothetical protein SADUNF_Sadunf16G0030400 [Salix dunnii]|uniref:Uncharacterized protein n=1 Tax=Salix dunnii TaxID=1413687 RepID=A0A835MKR6_9ROSI|nr:hypothetical protein SADUNF_Sadunf16G0030400 [Salix dunnii]